MYPILKPNVSHLVESVEVVYNSPESAELAVRSLNLGSKIYKLMDMWNQHCGSLGEEAHQVISESLGELLQIIGPDITEMPYKGEPYKRTLLNSSGVAWLNSIHRICLYQQCEQYQTLFRKAVK